VTDPWRQAVVREVTHPTPHAVRLRLAVPDRIQHRPGQHYVVRLTAPDGYTAARSYSLASPPSDDLVELYVERLADGEVSGYLADVVEVGDELEVRGPIGGWFVWTADQPAIAIGGGTGMVPLIAMLRHAQYVGRPELLRLVASARTLADLPYADELIAAGATVITTREDAPSGRPGARLTADDFGVIDPNWEGFVCGSAGFAETASTLLVQRGLPAERVRVERFGPTS
jgi:ferredoxin-NADP reductase